MGRRRLVKEYKDGRTYHVLEGPSPKGPPSPHDYDRLSLEDRRTVEQWRKDNPDGILFIGHARWRRFLKNAQGGKEDSLYEIRSVEFPSLFPESPCYKFCVVKTPGGSLAKIPSQYKDYYLQKGLLLLQPEEYVQLRAKDDKARHSCASRKDSFLVGGLELTADGALLNPMDGKAIDDIRLYKPAPWFKWGFKLPSEDPKLEVVHSESFGRIRLRRARPFYLDVSIFSKRLSSDLKTKVLKMTWDHLHSLKGLLGFTERSDIKVVRFKTVSWLLDFLRHRDLSEFGLGPVSADGGMSDDPRDQDSRLQGQELIHNFPWRFFPHLWPDDGPELHVHYNTGTQVHLVLCKDDPETHKAMEWPIWRNSMMWNSEADQLRKAVERHSKELGLPDDEIVRHAAPLPQSLGRHEHLRERRMANYGESKDG